MPRKKKLKSFAIDLFCGCGGLSLGLKQAGFDVLAGIDSDPLACSTYRMNHGKSAVVESDISLVDPHNLMARLCLRPGDLGLLAGCPPCQGFSTLRTLNGQRNVDEPMNDLIFQFTRFISCFRPKAIMIENVPGLASDPRLKSFCKGLAAMGYKYRFEVFDASDFGVPQRRRRMILIAALSARPAFAKASTKRPAVWDAIASLPLPEMSDDPAHNYQIARASHVEALIKKVPKDGGSRAALGESAQLPCHRRCDGFKDVYGRMAWLDPGLLP